MNLNDALTIIGGQLNINPDLLIAYANEDQIGGFHADIEQRQWPLGSMYAVEGQFIYALIRALTPNSVLECGVGNGCTSAHILQALDRNDYGELTSLDPTPYPTPKDRIEPGVHERWTFYRQDAVSWLKKHSTNFDIVIEDAMHDYDLTCNILSHLSDPFLVISHDSEHVEVGPDVKRAWAEVYGEFTSVLIEPSDCGLCWHIEP